MADDWLNPLNALKLQMALRTKRPSVYLELHDPLLSQKRKIRFDITYEGEKFFIMPSDNQGAEFSLSPCGWFETKRVLDPSFLERERTRV